MTEIKFPNPLESLFAPTLSRIGQDHGSHSHVDNDVDQLAT